MTKAQGISIFFVLVVAGLLLLTSRCSPPDLRIERLFDDQLGAWFLGAWTLGALPIAFCIPRMRASFFGRWWRVPSQTYVVPLLIIRVCLLSLWGQILGLLVVAIWHNPRVLWLTGSFLIVSVAFWAGARHRLRLPRAEFEMPWIGWGPGLRR